MDAVMFVKEWKRMCRSSKTCLSCSTIVEKWSAEHPMKMRQSEFLKIFPNAVIQNGVIQICPRNIDQNSITSEECEKLVCCECRKKYWFAEVE